MKKLLVLALVLSMASMANATLTLTLSGPTALAQGAVGTYSIGYSTTGEGLISFDADIASTTGTIGGGVILATNRDTSLDWTAADSLTGLYEITLINDVAMTDFGVSPIATFTLTAPMANGVSTISLIENSFYDTGYNQIVGTVMPSMNVQVGVPEPITMTLLGLGGLFLRRRSK